MTTKYSDKQLIQRMMSLPSFQYLPGNYHIIAVRSKADLPNQFDDKIYLFEGTKGLLVSMCTTNPGSPALLGGWKKYTSGGAAIIKADEIYYDAFQASDGKTIRHHNGKMPCLRLIKKIKYYRDKNNDNKVDETGPIYIDNYATNIHFNSYNIFDKIKNIIQKWIGEWSYGCIVLNEEDKYEDLYLKCKSYGKPITFTLLKEF